MAALSGTELWAIVVVVVLCIALAAIGLSVLGRLKRRRAQLQGELSSNPEAVSDRAFNRISMARREADVLARQGHEVPRARELIGTAQAAFDARQFDRAYELAQSAHETLVAARQRPMPASNASAAPEPPTSPSAVLPPPRLIPHQAEAQFQLRVLATEIERAPRGKDGRRKRGEVLLAEAQAAYEKADYTGAFRSALKGRRELGAPLETVAPAGSSPPAGNAVADPTATAEAMAGADRCPECGHPMASSDPFCPGCGTTRAAPA